MALGARFLDTEHRLPFLKFGNCCQRNLEILLETDRGRILQNTIGEKTWF